MWTREKVDELFKRAALRQDPRTDGRWVTEIQGVQVLGGTCGCRRPTVQPADGERARTASVESRSALAAFMPGLVGHTTDLA